MPLPTVIPGAAPGFEFADVYAIGLLFAGLALFAAVSALSNETGRAFTAAVVYLVLGAVAALGLHLLGVELLDPIEDSKVIERAAEIAVIIALFAAGLRLDRPLGWRTWRSTVLLIALVMPLTIAAIALFGGLVMGLSVGAAVILGASLAPTDPVLASAVQVGPPGEGEERDTHFALTSEAGLNDGLAFPFVLLGVFLAAEGGSWGEWFFADVLYAIGVGVALGALAGFALGRLASMLRDRGWLHAHFDAWLAVAAVLAIYGLTEVASAYGFLGAFAGGLAFRRHEKLGEHHARIHHGAEIAEKLTEVGVVLLLGSTITLSGLAEPGVAGWALVVLVLFAIRPLTVALAFLRSDFPRRERAFIAWFGIRGIGSFYYAAAAISLGALPSGEAAVVYWTIAATVGVSIVLHGLTSTPAVRRL